MKTNFLLNAFSLQMLPLAKPGDEITVKFKVLEALPPVTELTSAIGHPDTARVLGVEPNRINVKLNEGDVAYVAQLVGGRLPEGATTLPEGFVLVPIKVTVKD